MDRRQLTRGRFKLDADCFRFQINDVAQIAQGCRIRVIRY